MYGKHKTPAKTPHKKSQLGTRQLNNVVSASLTLISSVPSPRGASQTLSIRICDRHFLMFFRHPYSSSPVCQARREEIKRCLLEYAIDTYPTKTHPTKVYRKLIRRRPTEIPPEEIYGNSFRRKHIENPLDGDRSKTRPTNTYRKLLEHSSNVSNI